MDLLFQNYQKFKDKKIENEDELIDYLYTLYNLNYFQEGLDATNKYENIIVKKYYEFIRYKLLFLINLSNFFEAKMIIENELNVPYIPTDFEIFLYEKRKEVNYELSKNKVKITPEIISNIDKYDDKTIISILPNLSDYNLLKYLRQFQNLLLSKKISNITKSLIIAVLSDQKINYDFSLIKDENKMIINPSSLIDIRESKNQLLINKLIQKYAAEIQLIDIASQLINMELLDHYPFCYNDEECNYLVIAGYSLAEEMTNISIKNKDYQYFKLNNLQKIENFRKKINNLLKTL